MATINGGSATADAGYTSPAVQQLDQSIRQYEEVREEARRKFDEITKRINKDLKLTRSIVLLEFSKISGIDPGKLGEDEREKLIKLPGLLKDRIFGQDSAVDSVSNAVKVFKAGQRSGDKPLPFLFLGPSGVGKTEMAKALASVLLDDEDALTRFDMSEYMEKHAVAKLIGAPPGYEGFSDEGGILTKLQRKNSNRVLLFDEIEKGHDDVFNIFLQILSDGRLTDPVGRTVPFRNTIIVMTTNIGQEEFLSNDNWPEAKAKAMEILKGRYRSEFLNRFNGRQNIMCFNKLDYPDINRIVRREINSINKNYGKLIQTKIDDADITLFTADHYDPAEGARGVPGYINANIEPFIVNKTLEDSNFRGSLNVVYNSKNKAFEMAFEEAK